MNTKTKNINQIIMCLDKSFKEIEQAKKYIKEIKSFTRSETMKIMNNCFDSNRSLTSLETDLLRKTSL